MLEIKALGNLVITKDGKPPPSLRSLRAQVILTYLALESGSHHRNYLASMFWPESSEEKALTSLRVVLTELRKGVGEYLSISRTDVSINPESKVILDVFELDELIKLGKIDRALNLYRGDLLTGIYIPGSVEFENWRRWESERIRIQIAESLEDRIKNRISLNRYQETAELSLRLLKIDPTNETANQSYSIALAMSGHRSAAVKHIQSFRKILREELGIEPSHEITDIQERISEGDLDSLEFNLKPKGNFPSQQTKFIGRVDELARLTKLITNPDCHLISIIGPGGIGKTCLAIQSIEANIQHFPDGVYFVPLEPVASSEGIFHAIAKAMDFKFDTIISLIDPQTQLLDVIGDSKIMLLLDSFEHLTKLGNQISILLNSAPNLRILVTSRHKLNVPSEWVLILEGMTTGESNTNHINDLPEALELFLHRVEQNNPGLVIRNDDMIPATMICELVEGLPLGIELAAGWTSVLSISEIASEISKTYEFLDGQPETNDKHQQIKAIFTSSWNLLDQSQQKTMAGLSVFQSGFSRHAAKQIIDATLTDLSTLQDKSMIRKNPQGKFEIHSVIHEFCREILLGSPQEWQSIRLKHFQYYAEYLYSRIPVMYTLNENCTCLEIKNELPNIQAAAEFAALTIEEFLDQEIIKNLYSYYIIHGWHEGGVAFQRLAELVIENQSKDPEIYGLLIAKIQAQRGFFYSNLGLIEESEEICQKSLSVLEEAKELRELAICIQNLGINAIFRGEYDQAFRLLNKAINISKLTSCSSFPSFYLWVGYVHFLLGNYQQGMESFFISLDLFEQDNNDRGTAFSLSKMGLAQDGLGNYQKANSYHEKSLRIFRESDNQAGQGYALSRMSLGALLLKDYQSALKFGEEALVEFRKIGHRWGKCASLSRIAYAKLGLCELTEARQLFLEALSIAHDHQLDPLSLHALAGIACLKVTTGEKKDGQALMEYVQKHSKTPEIYITVNRKWFKIEKKQKMEQRNQVSDPELAFITGKILEQEN
ncbi:MAG: tetratricopeptide repeat protein [Anaerolineales bacterium]